MMCQVLNVSASGYYTWCRRPESAHAQRDRQLRVLVRASFDASKHRYGSPRIYEDLREQQVRISRKRVIRLMQEDGLKARARKRFKCTTMSDHDQPVAANLLDRRFTAAMVNQRWVGDTTEFVIGESGKLYLAAILDLFSRFVVGWAVSAVAIRSSRAGNQAFLKEVAAAVHAVNASVPLADVRTLEDAYRRSMASTSK
jgi:putative transposase